MKIKGLEISGVGHGFGHGSKPICNESIDRFVDSRLGSDARRCLGDGNRRMAEFALGHILLPAIRDEAACMRLCRTPCISSRRSPAFSTIGNHVCTATTFGHVTMGLPPGSPRLPGKRISGAACPAAAASRSCSSIHSVRAFARPCDMSTRRAFPFLSAQDSP